MGEGVRLDIRETQYAARLHTRSRQVRHEALPGTPLAEAQVNWTSSYKEELKAAEGINYIRGQVMDVDGEESQAGRPSPANALEASLFRYHSSIYKRASIDAPHLRTSRL